MAETMRAYFFGTSFGETVEGSPVGLAGFAIPDLGVISRSRATGGIYECQYEALLSLLNFIETNKKYLKEFEFEVMTDSALIVYQISHKKFISRDLAPLYNHAIEYKKRVLFRVNWVPRDENVAITGLVDVPPMKTDVELKFQFDTNSSFKIDQPLFDSRNPLT
jgi:hypothetical protein